MKARILGRSGIQVSAMGLGCASIGGPYLGPSGQIIGHGHVREEKAIRAIQKGLELGITLFDTSNAYCCGRSEQILGKALEGHREEIIIATKFGLVWDLTSPNISLPCQVTGENVTPEFIRDSCRGSLERLQTDYIDLYQLHINRMNPEKAPSIMETLEELVEDGRIRHYGWSTDDPDRAKIFAQGKHCTIVQFKHNLTFHNKRMIKEVIQEFNVAGLIKGPLGSGILTGKYQDDSKLPGNHLLHGINFSKGRIAKVRELLEEMKDILTADGRTLAQAALGWIWAQNERLIPIPGFTNLKQVEENARTLEFGVLTQDQVKQVEQILPKINTVLSKGYFT